LAADLSKHQEEWNSSNHEEDRYHRSDAEGTTTTGKKLTADSVNFPTYKQQVNAEIETKLADIEADFDIPTCEDFAHLGVECCPVCHLDTRSLNWRS
jgi:hypothetical protein